MEFLSLKNLKEALAFAFVFWAIRSMFIEAVKSAIVEAEKVDRAGPEDERFEFFGKILFGLCIVAGFYIALTLLDIFK